MSPVAPRLLKGFRDYLPAKMIPRQRMLSAIEATFQRFGFAPLMTPVLEHLDILAGKYGDEGETLMYRFADRGGRDVGMRYDLTVPLARVVAQYDLPLPFRRYQIAPVWRAENPQRGRYREFVQCDADIVGTKDMVADAELVELACELLAALGVDNYRVRINNRKVLSGLMRRIGVDDAPGEMAILRTIDKLDKIGADKTRELLGSENGLSAESVDVVFEFLEIAGDPRAILARLAELFPSGEDIGGEGRVELAQVFDILEGVGLSDRVEIDLSIARGLTYYTGTIYETFLTNLPGYGAVMGGGRYDGLIGKFKGKEIPGVGISLGIDRLLEALVELGVLREEGSVARVLVAVFDADTAPYAHRVAQEIRRAGHACELFSANAKLKKQLRHADRQGQRWVVIAGSDEIAREEVAIKDLESGTQESVPLSGLGAFFDRAN